ncbi:UAA transporter [Paraphysoderma sedebokerense]|nr:UAA transporter [Paraphysoderma sedebokerense]
MLSKKSSIKKHVFWSSLQISLSDWLLLAFLIFGGCCSNVYSLELIVRQVPHSGHLITFSQFLFVSIEGFIAHFDRSSRYFLRPTVIPLRKWVIMVLLFLSGSVLNNKALGYKISMPLHIIFRSGSLIVSMVLGWLLMGKRYTIGQVGSVITVTAGVILSTYTSAHSDKASDHSNQDLTEYITGITLLTIALILSCFLGLFQEITYQQYGREWREGLFYSHFLSLPFFIFFLPSIKPALDTITQYVCISGVHRLTSMSSSLTLNLVLTLRKFVSLVISVIVFQNPLSRGMIVGGMMVFAGGMGYAWFSTMINMQKEAARKEAKRRDRSARQKGDGKEKEKGKTD